MTPTVGRRPLIEPLTGSANRLSLGAELAAAVARVRRVRARSRLRSAVACSTPEVRYQPQVSLRDGAVVGAEALVGWRSPSGEPLATEAVIEMAEDSGAIVDLGAQVLRTAARQGASWRRAGHEVRLSVNLSVRQLSWPSMVEVLEQVLDETGLPATALTLELTETLLLSGAAETLGTLERLRAAGVRVAIDDFGTGYSGLDHLRRLAIDPVVVDELKVDAAFVVAAGSHERAEVLLRGMIQIGRDLGLHVVAEGVENVSQAQLLRRLGCDVAQGYLFSTPLSAGEMDEFLLRGAFDLDQAPSVAASSTC